MNKKWGLYIFNSNDDQFIGKIKLGYQKDDTIKILFSLSETDSLCDCYEVRREILETLRKNFSDLSGVEFDCDKYEYFIEPYLD